MDIDYGIVADRIVKDCIRLGKKDSLGVHTTEHMLPLAKEIVKAARRAGADTVISLDSDDIWYDALLNLPASWLKSPSTLGQAFLRASTAQVYIEGPRDPSRMRDIPPERWAANDKGATATYKPFEKRNVPTLDLSISRVTEARARTYGFDYGEWHSSSLQAMAVDPKLIRTKGEPVARALSRARKGRVTAPRGTDFEFEFQSATPTLSNGEIRPRKGVRSSYHASLPDGAVAIALKKGSGEGKVVSTLPIPQAGHLIRALSWEFEGGRMRKVDADEHLDVFKMFFTEEKRKKGADQLGWMQVGLNPAAKCGFLENSIVEGVVTIGIGDNSELGGNNRSAFGTPAFLNNATLEVDGKRLVSQGRIVA
jgi:leucyl aminopeptidase (aminopeptidase T)